MNNPKTGVNKDIIADVPKALKKNHRKAVASVIQMLESKSRRFTMKDLHQFRVGIKKIRASLDLLHSIKSNFERNRYLRPLKELFTTAGKLRTTQVERALLKDYGLFDRNSRANSYMKDLTSEERSNRTSFYKAIDNPGVAKKLKKSTAKVKRLLGKLHEDDVRKYLALESSRLEKALKKYGPDESRLHIVRKKVKNFFLNAKSMFPKGRLGSLNAFQDLLGEWHDRKVTFDQLMKVVTAGKLKASEVERLNTIKTQLLAEKEKLFDEIVTNICFKPQMHLIPVHPNP